MGYCFIIEDMNYVHRVGTFPELAEEHSFLSGKWIDLVCDQPFYCEVDCTVDESPCHFLDELVPIFSSEILEQLQLAGIDNFQKFPVTLRNSALGLEWPNYFAVNVLGMIDSADLSRSSYDDIMPGDDDGTPELVHFEELVIDPVKARGALMFRDLRSPEQIIFDDKIIDYLKSSRPADGWRIRIKLLNNKS
jgi:hypothetical protein